MKVSHAPMLWFLPMLAEGCQRGDKCEAACDSTSPPDSDSASASEGEGEGDSLQVDWDASGLTVTLPSGYAITRLGMAETDPSSFDPWTGEDCVRGYTQSDGSTLLYCHPVAGSSLTLLSASDFTTLDEDTQTAFWRSSANAITYAIWDDSTGACWTWGNDPSYYTIASIGCQAIAAP